MGKVKRYRYKSIYSTHRRQRPHGSGIWKTVLLIIGAAVLLFVGWSVAKPVEQFFAGTLKPARSVSSAVTAAASSKKASASSAAKTSETAGALRGIYLPKADLTDLAALATTAGTAKSAGINFAVIDLKAEDGKINYDSKQAEAVAAGLTTPGVDASKAAAALKADGITPCARICAFLDPAAAASDNMRAAAVKYALSHDSRWYDASHNFWLNPYSDQARQYIIDIAKEAVAAGYKDIMLDGLEFPTTGSPDKLAWFSDSTESKEQVLRDFVKEAKQQIAAVGGKVIVRVPGASLVGSVSALSGQDQNVFGYGADWMSPDLCPYAFGASLQAGATAVQNPDTTPGKTVTALAQFLATQGSRAQVSTAVPYIQAFTNSSAGGGLFKTYTADDINQEISALHAVGIDSFILYNPAGTYDFSGVKVK